MSVTQATQMAEDLKSLLVTFGESVVFTPKGGQARTLTAIVQRRGLFLSDSDHARSTLMRSVTVLKDQYDATYGGISEVNVGDTMVIDNRVMSHTGITTDENAAGWSIEFQTTRMERMGSNVANR